MGTDWSSIERRRITKETYADLVPVVRDLRDGGSSLNAVAAALNALGQRTQRGGMWNSGAIQRFLKREGLPPLPPVLRYNAEVSADVRRRGIIASRAAFAAKWPLPTRLRCRSRETCCFAGATKPAIVQALNDADYGTPK